MVATDHTRCSGQSSIRTARLKPGSFLASESNAADWEANEMHIVAAEVGTASECGKTEIVVFRPPGVSSGPRPVAVALWWF